MDDLRNKPWNHASAEIPRSIYEPKGVLSEEERRCLYWLARHVFSNCGSIVDAGAYIGSSAYCLAEGLLHAGYADRSRPIIHSYDPFVVLDDHVAESISRDVRHIRPGDTFLDIFYMQNARHNYLIETHVGNFLKQHWSNSQIEILFIDIAKSRELNSHVVREFFPYLIPGHSIVIQREFYHVWHPAIHVTMQYLKRYFQVIDPYVPFQSRVYRLIAPIRDEDLDRAARYDFSLSERLALIADAASESPSPTKEMLEAIAMYEPVIDGSRDAYGAAKSTFEQRHPEFRSRSELWAAQAQAVEVRAREIFGDDNEGTFVNDATGTLDATKSFESADTLGVSSNLDEILLDHPSFHRQEDGSPWFLGISDQNLKFMASLLRPGMRTVETGAGFSTLAFIATRCNHTAICPEESFENQRIERRIRDFCREHNLDTSSFLFLNARSQDVLPNLNTECDFVFIDGDHAFPIPIIDFYYLARRLKVGGVLAIDDTNIWTGDVVAKHLMLDSDWEFICEQDAKTAYFRLLAPFTDKGFSSQTYVVANSRSMPAAFLQGLKR